MKTILMPLGTVAPYPKDNKNCPGFLVKHGDYNILFDCGNGCVRNMNIPDDLKNLKIFITHLHPDHYGDLNSLLQTIGVYKNYGFIKDKIQLFIPNGFGDNVIKEYALSNGVELLNGGNNVFDDIRISAVKVPHQIESYAYKIETPSGIIVYSGDTGTNNVLREFAKNCNIFICESTFLRGQTRKKDYHLYAYEASKIANDAGVEKLLLTHFWPEIDKEEYVKEAQETFQNVEAAEEGKQYILRR